MRLGVGFRGEFPTEQEIASEIAMILRENEYEHGCRRCGSWACVRVEGIVAFCLSCWFSVCRDKTWPGYLGGAGR